MKKLFKHLFRLLGLLIVVILIVGFCFDKKVPSSWCEGKFDGLTEKLEISGMEDIENYPYKKFSSKTIEASYNQNKKTVDKETTVSIEKSVDKDGTFTMKVTKTTKTNTTSGSKTSEEKYTYAKKDGKFMSIDDMKIRSKIGASVIEMLQKVGCLKGMSQSNQLSLFG